MSNAPEYPTGMVTADEQMYNDIHAALCANGFNTDTANFLADLAMRVRKLEEKQ